MRPQLVRRRGAGDDVIPNYVIGAPTGGSAARMPEAMRPPEHEQDGQSGLACPRAPVTRLHAKETGVRRGLLLAKGGQSNVSGRRY